MEESTREVEDGERITKTYSHFTNIPLDLRHYERIDGHRVEVNPRDGQGYIVETHESVFEQLK